MLIAAVIICCGIFLLVVTRYRSRTQKHQKTKDPSPDISPSAPPPDVSFPDEPPHEKYEYRDLGFFDLGDSWLPVDSKEAVVISSAEDWNKLWPSMMNELQSCPILGVACFVEVFDRQKQPPPRDNGNRDEEETSSDSEAGASLLDTRKKDIYQVLSLCTGFGLCAVIRLESFVSEAIPQSLRNILANPQILKIGWHAPEDMQRIATQIGVPTVGSIDIRFVTFVFCDFFSGQTVVKNRVTLPFLCHVFLNEDFRSCSRPRESWLRPKLTLCQMDFATFAPAVSVALFHQIVIEKSGYRFLALVEGQETAWNSIFEKCERFLNKKFTAMDRGVYQRKFSMKKEDFPTGVILGVGAHDTYVPVQSRHTASCDNTAIAKEAGCLRQFPLRPVASNLYRKLKSRRCIGSASCVVCGSAKGTISRSILPVDYERHFPRYMSVFKKFDFVSMCIPCDELYVAYAWERKRVLAAKCQAPLTSGGTFIEDDKERATRWKVREAGCALLKDFKLGHLSDNERQALSDIVKNQFCYLLHGVCMEAIIKAAKMRVSYKQDDPFKAVYVAHGLRVVIHCGFREGLVEFRRGFRRLFVESLAPKHLPKDWAVEAGEDELFRILQNKVREMHGAKLPPAFEQSLLILYGTTNVSDVINELSAR